MHNGSFARQGLPRGHKYLSRQAQPEPLTTGICAPDRAELLQHAPWLGPVLQTLEDGHMAVARIAPMAGSGFRLALKPPHCAPKHQNVPLSLELMDNGTSEIVLPAEYQTLDPGLEAQLAQIQADLVPHLAILTKIHAVAQQLPSHKNIVAKLYQNPWAVYVARKLTQLPQISLSQLRFCTNRYGPYGWFNFNYAEPEKPSGSLQLSLWPFGRQLQTNIPEAHKNDKMATLFHRSANECRQTVALVHRLVQTTDDPSMTACTLFHYPGLITCARIAARNGATIKGAMVYPEARQNEPIAELRLAHPRWLTAEGQTLTLRFERSGNVEHNVLASEKTSWNGTLSCIKHFLCSPRWLGKRPDMTLSSNIP